MATPDEAPARELLQEGFDHFTRVVHQLPDDAWTNQTPCTDWTVRDLLNHVTAEHLWAPRLLAGETMAQVGDAYDGDVLGDDPEGTWDTVEIASREAWAAASDDTTVDLSFGPTPAGEYAEQMLLDLTVHAWDLARGAGVPDDTPDPAAVLHVLAYVRDNNLAGASVFGPPVETSSDNPMDQLVALLGRKP
ncbi:TIGR03086 family metal-binding protein [Rhodococcus sp. X156]|uniref:TIGR03086 family metal-binding protein n=1 Tax=Rhodococcus sp. X156 TaxID=2499145 RepID=UPI000FD7E0C5|nr:TIGR03086 family metal-binding protein [Rhodococcus sp. X156]